MAEPSWTLVVAVKHLAAAKSRLRGAVPGVPHEQLALALAEDTVRAALRSAPVGELLVVTADPRAAAVLGALGARIVPEPPGGGLNAAFTHGAAAARSGWVAALTADLPALQPTDLAGALRAAAAGPPGVRRFVADAPGTGTVLLATAPGIPLNPRFGRHSAAAHLSSGAHPLSGAWPTLRRDVDVPADLAAAADLGLGPRTAELAQGGATAVANR